MNKNPFRVSSFRSVCGHKAPFIIGVFLVFSLVFAQPIIVLGEEELVSSTENITQEIVKEGGEVVTEITPIQPPSDEIPADQDPPVIQREDVITPPEESTEEIEKEENKEETDISNIPGNTVKSKNYGNHIEPTVSVEDGSLSYVYQIETPPGRNNFGPDIKLVYNSNDLSRGSVVGAGWNFNIPFIQRVNKNGTDKLYVESNFTSSFDGELVKLDSENYIPRTENGSFLKYKYDGTKWTVLDKKGVEYVFGQTAQARQDDPENANRVYTWMLEKMTDTNGNKINFKYSKDQGQIYPNSISYNQDAIFTIDFLKTSISNPSVSYASSFKVLTSYRIHEIKIKVDGTLVKKYSITSSDSFVKSLSLTGYNLDSQATTLPPISIKYPTDDGQKKWKLDSGFNLPTDSNNKVLTLEYQDNTSIFGNSWKDINGDGLPDVIRWVAGKPNGYVSLDLRNGNQVFINTGSGFKLDPGFTLPTISSGQVVALEYNDPSGNFGNSFVDINGDGLVDVIRWKTGQPNGYSSLTYGNQVFINTGTGFRLDPNFLLPADASGKVFTLDFNKTNFYGNSFKDVNGDNLPDVVRWTAGQLNGYQSPDFKSGNQVFINTGTGFRLDPGFILPTAKNGQVVVLDYKDASGMIGNTFKDINGDRLIDVVRWSQGQPNGYTSASPQNISGNQVFINTGVNFKLDPNFLLPTDSSNNVVSLEFKNGNVWGSDNYGSLFQDINADGLLDIVRWRAGQPNGYAAPSYGNQVFLNTGTSFKLDPNFLLPADASGKVLTLDFNYFPVPSTKTGAYGNSWKDINGDGLLDIIRWAQGKPNSYFNSNLTSGNQVFINTGTGFVQDASFSYPTDNSGMVTSLDYNENYVSGNSLQDINGDGLLDIVQWAQGKPNGYSYSTQYLFYGNQIYLNQYGRREVSKIISSAGGFNAFEYKAIRGYTNSQNFGVNSNIPEYYNSYVVSTFTTNDNNGNVGVTKYKYENADYFYNKTDPFDRRFTGFQEVTKTGPDGSIRKYKYHQGNERVDNEPEDSFPKIGKLYESSVSDSRGNLYLLNRNDYGTVSIGGNAYFVKLFSELSQQYDGNSSHRDTAKKYIYDDYGNIKQEINFGEVFGSSDGTFVDISTDKLITDIYFALNAKKYIVSLPSRIVVTGDGGKKVKEEKFYYDNLSNSLVDYGNNTKTEKWKTGSGYVTTKATYDDHGLLTSQINERGKITTYIYDAYNLYPTLIKNPIGQINELAYDYATGKLIQRTEENGFVYKTSYDGLGRIVEEKIPDLNPPYAPVTKTKYEYFDLNSGKSVKVMNYLDDVNIVDSYKYLDGFDRLIQTKDEAEGISNFNTKDFIYDEMGLLKKESLSYMTVGVGRMTPIKESSLYINYKYDILGRKIETISSVNSTSINYDDWNTTSFDANKHEKRYYKDAYGNLVKVEEINGNNIYTTNYKWNEIGNLIQITDAIGNIRSFSYDALGERISATDLHSQNDLTYGVWQYAYDDAGNLIQTTSPKGDVTNYTYDDLNRVYLEYTVNKDAPEYLYAYDGAILTCENANGKLCAVFTDNGTNVNYKYDSRGNIAIERKYIGSIDPYKTEYEYNRQGNIVNIKYPDDSEVKYTYNNSGSLDKIDRSDDGVLFIPVIANFDYSPMGQVISMIGANGTASTIKSYDATKLYRLTNTKTVNNAQFKLQDISYEYDAEGNVKKIVDTSNTDTTRTVDYVYDDLDRLISATASGVAVSRTPYTQNFSYDPVGNILSSSFGTYTYSQIGYTNPHAVTKIVSPNYEQNFLYDLNGNLVGRTTIALTSVLNGSVSPNGLPTEAGFTGSGINTVQSIGNGSSSVEIGPVNLTDLSPNSNYIYKISGSNTGSGNIVGGSLDGENSIVISTNSGPKPAILAYSVGSIGKYTATIMAQINPNGRSTDAWYEFQGAQKSYTHLPDCNTPYDMEHVVLTGLSANTTYKIKVVAKNDKGTTDSGFISFKTLPEPPPPPPPPAIPPPPPVYKYPFVTSISVKTNVPSYELDNSVYVWDYKNRLSVASNSTSTNKYLYDYQGNRLKNSVFEKNTNKTYEIFTPTRLYEVSRALSTDDIVTKYIYAGDKLVATVKKIGAGIPEVSYVYSDHLGGTNVTAKSDGSLLSTLDYYPFGAQRICAGECDMGKKYIGQYFDVDTSLNYLNARYYDSTIGRFISQDPMFWNPEKFLTDPQSMNSYSYARNNPIMLVDSNGESWETFWDGATSIVDYAIDHPVETGGMIVAGAVVAFFAPEIAVVGGVALGLYATGTALSNAFNAKDADTRDYYLGEGTTNAILTAIGVKAGAKMLKGKTVSVQEQKLLPGPKEPLLLPGPYQPYVKVKSFGQTLYEGNRDVSASVKAFDDGVLSPRVGRGGQPTVFRNERGFNLENRGIDGNDYIEYNLIDGKSSPGKTSPERFLIGSKEGQIYYSPDHYDSQPIRIR